MYATRPAATLSRTPVAVNASMRPRSRWRRVRWAWSDSPVATYTPVAAGSVIPDVSSASRTVSRIRRCPGSIDAASRGDSPNAAGSKSHTPSTNAPKPAPG